MRILTKYIIVNGYQCTFVHSTIEGEVRFNTHAGKLLLSMSENN